MEMRSKRGTELHRDPATDGPAKLISQLAAAELGRGERCESLRWDLEGREPGPSLATTLLVEGAP